MDLEKFCPTHLSALPAGPASPALVQGRFTGAAEFSELIRTAFSAAASEGWREIIISDSSFEDWPLGERRVAQALNDWSGAGRKLTMLAKTYTEVTRRHARFVSWRRTWAHLVECRGNSALSADAFPSALWSPVYVFQRLDLRHCSGIAGAEAARRVALREQLDECLRRSSPAFPATTLGI